MSVQSVPLEIRAVSHDHDRTVRSSWIKAMMLGEFVGFIPPAIAGTLAYRAGAPDWAMLPILAAAGSLEGAALGYAQSTVLNEELADFPRGRWVGATAAAAAGAWALGMIPSASGTFAEDHPMIIASGAVLLAPVLLNSIGLAQWLVLRRRVRGAGRWIPANAIAWLAGLPAVFIAMMALPNAAPAWVRAVSAVAGAVAMGAIVAAITGIALVRMLRDTRDGTESS